MTITKHDLGRLQRIRKGLETFLADILRMDELGAYDFYYRQGETWRLMVGDVESGIHDVSLGSLKLAITMKPGMAPEETVRLTTALQNYLQDEHKIVLDPQTNRGDMLGYLVFDAAEMLQQQGVIYGVVSIHAGDYVSRINSARAYIDKHQRGTEKASAFHEFTLILFDENERNAGDRGKR